jgi:sialate O-acetylesterase
MKYLIRAICLVAVCIINSAILRADVKLPAVISDGMVLQQGISVPLWGWADEGETVTVQFQNQKVVATAKGGKWMVRLKPLKAGNGPFTLAIAGKNKIELKNILIGEVWICSGQSNMQWSLKNTVNADVEIASAKFPNMRLFTVPRLESDTPVKDVKAVWNEASPETVAAFSAVGYYFGRDLQKARNVPIGLINNAVGGSPAESWMKAELLKADEEYRQFFDSYPQKMEQYQKALEKYKEDAEKAKADGKPTPRAPGKPWLPSGLYNGMLAPLIPYAIRGVIWYQGEANASRAYQYRRLFPDMIKNWRSDWGQGDFPFIFVQLAAFGPNAPTLGESDWAEIREAQAMTLKVPKTGMAVAIDVGDINDIHPRDKQPVGARLALAARAVAYGEKIVYSGPSYKTVSITGNKATISFDHTGAGLESRGGELKGFIMAGEDRVWHVAKAEIKGNQVEITSDSVAKPVAIRYGWAKYPECNLYNKEGLPASPFRTDRWPGITQPKPQP